MKVPRINLGVEVQQPNYSQVLTIYSVDYQTRRFFARSTMGMTTLGEFTFEEYSPAYTWSNFAQALREWDYHWKMSDDSRLLEEGQEMQDALTAFARRLFGKDKDQLRQKIVEIVVISATPA